MKVTVLIENTSNNNLACEHGLSIFLEEQGRKMILDAGSTEAFWDNAKRLGIDLTEIDTGILSHGHYDHSGGLKRLFQNNTHVKVYARREAMESYFSGSGEMHEIGIPQNVISYKERFELVDDFLELFPGVYLVPHNSKGLEKIGEKSKLYKMSQGEIVPDDFLHEQSLVFETERGLVIFNSCSHGGVENIIREVKESCGQKHVYAYVGGLHMKGKREGKEICNFTEAEVDALCEVIEREDISYIYTGHCTGLVGLVLLKERLGDRVKALTTGLQFEL